jgi:ADP-heptose:LPS heptosyltransferase
MATGNGVQKKKSLRIVINGGLGDHLLISPFIRHFKKLNKYQHISCVVHQSSVELFDQNPHIDSLVPCLGNDLFLWGLPENDFDVFCPYVEVQDIDSLDDIGKIKSEHIFNFNRVDKPVIQQICEYHGLKLDDESLEIHTAVEDETWADQFIAPWSEKKIIFLNTSSALESKNYPLHLWQETVSLLTKEVGDQIIILEFPSKNKNLSGTLSLDSVPGLRHSAALFKRISCVVTVDSFPGHLAAAVDTPAIVLFGPSNIRAFGHKNNINIRTSNCPVCANTPRRDECKFMKCLADIPPTLIVEKILSIL